MYSQARMSIYVLTGYSFLYLLHSLVPSTKISSTAAQQNDDVLSRSKIQKILSAIFNVPYICVVYQYYAGYARYGLAKVVGIWCLTVELHGCCLMCEACLLCWFS